MEPNETIMVTERAVRNPVLMKVSALFDEAKDKNLTYPEIDKKLLHILEGYRSGYFILGFGFGGGVCVVVLKLLGVI